MNIRILLAVCIVVCCAFSGKAFAAEARRRADLINDLIEGLRLLRIYITGVMMENVRHALMETGCNALILIGEEMANGGNVGKAWRRAAHSKKFQNAGLDALKQEERDIIGHLFDRLGESNRESQKILIESAVKALEERLPEARKKASEAEKLYTTLGILSGLIVGLIMV